MPAWQKFPARSSAVLAEVGSGSRDAVCNPTFRSIRPNRTHPTAERHGLQLVPLPRQRNTCELVEDSPHSNGLHTRCARKKKAAHLTLILDPRRCLLVQVDLIHRSDILSDLPAPCRPASLPRLCNFAIRRSSFSSFTQPQRILVLTFSS